MVVPSVCSVNNVTTEGKTYSYADNFKVYLDIDVKQKNSDEFSSLEAKLGHLRKERQEQIITLFSLYNDLLSDFPH